MRFLAASGIGFAAGVFALAAAAGLTGSLATAAVGGVVVGLAVGWLIATRPVLPMDEGATSRPLKAVAAIAALAAAVQLARLTVFMVSAAHPGYSTIPS